jgi:predicted transcriptional regulator
MPQVTIYLDEETNKQLSEACESQKRSKSAIAAEAIRKSLSNRLPPEWFKVLGTWEDDRTHEEIMRDIRSGPEQRERAEFDE